MLSCSFPLNQWHFYVLILRHCMPRTFIQTPLHFRVHSKRETLQSTLLWIPSLSDTKWATPQYQHLCARIFYFFFFFPFPFPFLFPFSFFNFYFSLYFHAFFLFSFPFPFPFSFPFLYFNFRPEGGSLDKMLLWFAPQKRFKKLSSNLVNLLKARCCFSS